MKDQPTADSLPPFWEDEEINGKPIDLLSIFAVFLARWPFILATTVLGFLLALAISLVLTPRFSSQAVFLPPTQQGSLSDNPLASFWKTPSSALYIGLLLSDSLLDDVAERQNLQAAFHTRDIEATRTMLKSIAQVSYDTSGFVTLKVTYKDPQLAQQIATGMMDALARLNDRLAISSASRSRLLFQGEFEKSRTDLDAAELELKKAQEASGVVLPQTQTQAGLAAIDTARAEVRSKQIALAALLQGQTDQSPEVVRLRSEISAEQGQLSRLESGSGGAGAGLSASQAPGVNLKFVQLERQVRYNQVLFDLMARQLENAKLQENSAAPGVQLIDAPTVPLRKSWPRRSLFALVGSVVGLLLALLVVFIKDRARALRADPGGARSLDTLRQAVAHASFRP